MEIKILQPSRTVPLFYIYLTKINKDQETKLKQALARRQMKYAFLQ